MTATPGSAEVLALAAYHEAGCNRYRRTGNCSTRQCLVRAGWKIGDPIDYSKATCKSHETAVALRLAAKPAEEVREATIKECANLVERYGLDNLQSQKDYPATVAATLFYRIRALSTPGQPKS